MKRLIACAGAAWGLWVAGCGRDKVAPPVPRAASAWVDTLPPVPPSYIDVPVRYDLASALGWLESEVPAEFGDIEERKPVRDEKRTHYAYSARRTPFRLTISGRRLTLQADIEYEAKAWYDPRYCPR